MSKRNAEVRELLEQYLLCREFATCRKSTQTSYASVINRVMDMPFGSRKLNKLTFTSVDNFFDEWRKNHGNASALKMQAVMRTIWTYGVRHSWVEHNYWRLIKTRKEPSRDVVWPKEEIEKVRKFAITSPSVPQRIAAIIFYVAYAAVQRIGDIRSLLKTSIDADNSALSIEQSKGGKHVWVPMPPSAWELLQDALVLSGTSPWVFPARGGKSCVPHTTFFASFQNVKSAMNIPDTYHARDARRTAIMELAEKGANPIQIQSLSGHSSVTSIEPYLVRQNPMRNALAESAAALRGME